MGDLPLNPEPTRGARGRASADRLSKQVVSERGGLATLGSEEPTVGWGRSQRSKSLSRAEVSEPSPQTLQMVGRGAILNGRSRVGEQEFRRRRLRPQLPGMMEVGRTAAGPGVDKGPHARRFAGVGAIGPEPGHDQSCATGTRTATSSFISDSKKAFSAGRSRRGASRACLSAPPSWRCCWTASTGPRPSAAGATTGRRRVERVGQVGRAAGQRRPLFSPSQKSNPVCHCVLSA